ncbi:MAG: hypothetical protein CMH57_06720 [Myxococcales bacterium]|nr:hypothetical protein [Myxococcales bacterium]
MSAADLVRTAPAWTHVALKTLTLPPATTTNALLIGREAFVVVDPGADASREQARLAAIVDARLAAGDRLEAIVLTHHHIDHVSGLGALVEHLGGEVVVMAHEATWERVDAPDGARAVAVADGQRGGAGRGDPGGAVDAGACVGPRGAVGRGGGRARRRGHGGVGGDDPGRAARRRHGVLPGVAGAAAGVGGAEADGPGARRGD